MAQISFLSQGLMVIKVVCMAVKKCNITLRSKSVLMKATASVPCTAMLYTTKNLKNFSPVFVYISQAEACGCRNSHMYMYACNIRTQTPHKVLNVDVTNQFTKTVLFQQKQTLCLQPNNSLIPLCHTLVESLFYSGVSVKNAFIILIFIQNYTSSIHESSVDT